MNIELNRPQVILAASGMTRVQLETYKEPMLRSLIIPAKMIVDAKISLCQEAIDGDRVTVLTCMAFADAYGQVRTLTRIVKQLKLHDWPPQDNLEESAVAQKQQLKDMGLRLPEPLFDIVKSATVSKIASRTISSFDGIQNATLESQILSSLGAQSFSSLLINDILYDFVFLTTAVPTKHFCFKTSVVQTGWKSLSSFFEACVSKKVAAVKYSQAPNGAAMIQHILGKEEAQKEFKLAFSQARKVEIWISNDALRTRVKIGKSLVLIASQVGAAVGDVLKVTPRLMSKGANLFMDFAETKEGKRALGMAAAAIDRVVIRIAGTTGQALASFFVGLARGAAEAASQQSSKK